MKREEIEEFFFRKQVIKCWRDEREKIQIETLS